MKRPVDVHVLGSHVGGDSETFLSATLFRSVDGDHKSKLNFTFLEGVGGQRSQFFGIHCLSVATYQSGASIAFGNMAHRNQSGFRAGLINECDGHQSGVTVSALHASARNQSGLVLSVMNIVEKTAKGAFFSIYTHVGPYPNAMLDALETAPTLLKGAILSLYTQVDGMLHGFAASLCVKAEKFRGFILSPVTLIKDAENSAGLILGLVIIRLGKENWGDRLRFLFMRCNPGAKEQKPPVESQSLHRSTPRTA